MNDRWLIFPASIMIEIIIQSLNSKGIDTIGSWTKSDRIVAASGRNTDAASGLDFNWIALGFRSKIDHGPVGLRVRPNRARIPTELWAVLTVSVVYKGNYYVERLFLRTSCTRTPIMTATSASLALAKFWSPIGSHLDSNWIAKSDWFTPELRLESDDIPLASTVRRWRA